MAFLLLLNNSGILSDIPEIAPKTRQAWTEQICRDWPDLKMEVLDYVLFAVMHQVTPGMVSAKVLKGEHFGPLDLKALNPGKEALEELIDLFAYVHASRYQDEP